MWIVKTLTARFISLASGGCFIKLCNLLKLIFVVFYFCRLTQHSSYYGTLCLKLDDDSVSLMRTIVREMGKLKYTVPYNAWNIVQRMDTFDRIYLTSILHVQYLLISLHDDDNELMWCANQQIRPSGPAFIKPDQLDPWIKDQIGNTLLSTILHLQLPNFVSCGRDKPSHMTQNLVTVGVKL